MKPSKKKKMVTLMCLRAETGTQTNIKQLLNIWTEKQNINSRMKMEVGRFD